MQLILVRHALPRRVGSVGDSAGVTNGIADPELTDLGWRQAGRVSEALVHESVTALYTSPQRRAKQSAEPLVRVLGLTPSVDPDLAEYDTADPYYIPVHEMAEADPKAWQRMLDGQLPDHIDVRAFQLRVESAFDKIAVAHPHAETVVCFAHAGTINVYLAAILELARPLTFALDYTGITRVNVFRDGRREVRTVNEIAHVADILDPTMTAVKAPGKGS